MDLELIKNEIKVQTGWSDGDLKEAMDYVKKELEGIIGSSVDEELVLIRLVDLYEEIKIEELETKAKLGERVKYADIDLDNFPSEKNGGKPFQDLFQGKCLAGCVTSMFRRTYEPQDYDGKAPKIDVYIADDSGEFNVTVFGKNEDVIKKWDNISIGDYVEISCVKVLEKFEKNDEYDNTMEEDEEDNPRFLPTGKPKFWFLFASESLESVVQKIDHDKYPELPTLEDLFACKTMSEFESVDGGRYITNGIILSIDKDATGKKGRTIKGYFYVQIGKKSKRVVAIFQNSATKILPTEHSRLRNTRLKVLGWYNPENNIYKIDKVISLTKSIINNATLVKVNKKKKAKPKKKQKEERDIQADISDVLNAMIEDDKDDEEFDFNLMVHYDLPDEWDVVAVVEAMKEREETTGDVVVVDDVIPTFKFSTSEDKEVEDEEIEIDDEDEDSDEDDTVDEVTKEDNIEEADDETKENIKNTILEHVEIVSNPTALIQFVNMTQQIGNKDIVKGVYDSLVEEGILVESDGHEKVTLKEEKKKAKAKKKTTSNPDTKIIIKYFVNNPSQKGYTLAQLKRTFPDVAIHTIMKKHFSEPVKITVKGRKAEIRNHAPNKWRLVFV